MAKTNIYPRNTKLPQQYTTKNISWADSTVYYDEISDNQTYTFSNLQNGATVILVVKNVWGATVTIQLPTVIVGTSMTYDVLPNASNVYTFVIVNDKIYATVIPGMY